jgi:hypothetical protein
MLTQERLKELFSYDPETGLFVRIKKSGKSCSRIGSIVGAIGSHGYFMISIDNTRYLCHRLAFLYMTGNWPLAYVDHIDQNKRNNRFKNLREVSNRENMQNSSIPKHSTTRILGVSYEKRRKCWRATICVDGKQVYLGQFKTPEEAGDARKDANLKYGFHKNHGRKIIYA